MLPCLETVAEQAADQDSSDLAIPPENCKTSSASGRILIVEDNEDSALVIQLYLKPLGYQIQISTDGGKWVGDRSTVQTRYHY